MMDGEQSREELQFYGSISTFPLDRQQLWDCAVWKYFLTIMQVSWIVRGGRDNMITSALYMRLCHYNDIMYNSMEGRLNQIFKI